MFARMTDRCRIVLAMANRQAQRLAYEYIATEHLLLGLIEEGSGLGAEVLSNLGVDLRRLATDVETLSRDGSREFAPDRLPQTMGAKRVVEHADEESRELDHAVVGTAHLLLGLVRENDGIAAKALTDVGLTRDTILTETLRLLGEGADFD